MKVLFWGLSLFCLAFFIQVALWKLRLPARQTKALMAIFIGTLAASLVFFLIVPSDIKECGIPVLSTLPECLLFIILFFSLTLAHMITYSAIEADSPSLVMIIAVAQAGKKGLSQEAFDKAMDNKLMVEPRIRDLVTDKMAVVEDGKYILTKKGVALSRLFIFYRSLLNAPKGG